MRIPRTPPEQQYALIDREIAEHRAPHVHVGPLVATMLRLERGMTDGTARQLIAAAHRDGFIVTAPGSTSAPAP